MSEKTETLEVVDEPIIEETPPPVTEEPAVPTVEEDTSIQCWICYEDANTKENPLITPCMCTGSLSFVHHDCLSKWIMSSGKKNCQQCKYEFKKNVYYLHPLYRYIDNHFFDITISCLFIFIMYILYFYLIGSSVVKTNMYGGYSNKFMRYTMVMLNFQLFSLILYSLFFFYFEFVYPHTHSDSSEHTNTNSLLYFFSQNMMDDMFAFSINGDNWVKTVITVHKSLTQWIKHNKDSYIKKEMIESFTK